MITRATLKFFPSHTLLLLDEAHCLVNQAVHILESDLTKQAN